MRRFMLLLVSFFLMIGNVWCDDTSSDNGTDNNIGKTLAEANFNIKGYKVGEEDYLKIAITDAINNSDQLNTIDDGEPIILDRHMDDLASSEPAITNGSAQVVFSYRVAGNTANRYTIEFEIDPFENTLDSEKRVGAYYALGNQNFVFPGNPSLANSKDILIDMPETDLRATVGSTSGWSSGVLKQSWSVPQNNSGELWMSRGAIMMVINENDYSDDSKVPYGIYKALIKVTLTEG